MMLVDSIKRFFGRGRKQYPETIVDLEERMFSQAYVDLLTREIEFLRNFILKEAVRGTELSNFTKDFPVVHTPLTPDQQEIMEKAKPRSARFIPFSDARARVEKATRKLKLEQKKEEKNA